LTPARLTDPGPEAIGVRQAYVRLAAHAGIGHADQTAGAGVRGARCRALLSGANPLVITISRDEAGRSFRASPRAGVTGPRAVTVVIVHAGEGAFAI